LQVSIAAACRILPRPANFPLTIPTLAPTLPFVNIEEVHANVWDCFATRARLIGLVADTAAALQLMVLTVQAGRSVRLVPIPVWTRDTTFTAFRAFAHALDSMFVELAAFDHL